MYIFFSDPSWEPVCVLVIHRHTCLLRLPCVSQHVRNDRNVESKSSMELVLFMLRQEPGVGWCSSVQEKAVGCSCSHCTRPVLRSSV